MLYLHHALSVYFCLFLFLAVGLVSACNADFFNNFLAVAEGPYEDVVKLQTMRCLFEAYEHVLSLLENVFTPMFCHSDEVSLKDFKSSPEAILLFSVVVVFVVYTTYELHACVPEKYIFIFHFGLSSDILTTLRKLNLF